MTSTARRAAERTRRARRAIRPTKASSVFATRTAATSACCRAAFRCAASPHGPVVRIVGTHLDLTERKRAEAALRESEERLTARLRRGPGRRLGLEPGNQTPSCIRRDGRQMLGYGEDEIESHVSAWERLVHPDDRASADQAQRARRERRPRPTRLNSGCGTRTGTTSMCCRAATRSGGSPKAPSSASSAPISTSPSGSAPKRCCVARTRSSKRRVRDRTAELRARQRLAARRNGRA